MLKHMWKKQNLFLRIAVGFLAGIAMGFLFPDFSKKANFVGTIYLNLIRMMIVPVIFFSVSTGIMNLEDTKTLRRIGLKTIVLFVMMFLLSSVISLLVAYLIRPGRGIVMGKMVAYEGELVSPSMADFFVNIVPSNIIEAMAKGNILSVILFSALFSVAVLSVKEKGKPVFDFVHSCSVVFFRMLDFVMETSPLGVASLMAFSIAQYGAGVFTALGKYIFTAYTASLAVFFVVMFIPTLIYTKIPPKLFLRGLFKIWMVTLSTTSSQAALPMSLKVSREEFKAGEEVSSFVLPLGCTINMCGGACSFCCLAVFVSDFYNVPLSLTQIVYLVIVATLINMGAPGIPGGGIVLGASFLSIIGLPIDLMGPIAAFYRLLDMAFTSMNVTGDIAANLIIAKTEGKLDPVSS
ncbi:MAG: dicarboxylate/amino acid:cation symporter [Filifactor alocis]|nr:dicarboxylate/amino acid:cation symporter [Filifactor alocis]